MSDIKCVVVTPEKTEIDVQATSVTVPLFDGELGILKNHSPLVGRLGYGALRIKDAAGTATSYFVEGGFVQVSANVVSVLTDSVIAIKEITAQSAEAAMRAALEMPKDAPEQAIARQKACDRARAMKRLAGA
jgi:F-type H+-transporting ATPase subunit epsilon